MKRFTRPPEPWRSFLDGKYWPEIKNTRKYAGKQLFIGSITDPYYPSGRNMQKNEGTAGAAARQRRGDQCSHKVRPGASGSGFDQNISERPCFMVCQYGWAKGSGRIWTKRSALSGGWRPCGPFNDVSICVICLVSPIFSGSTDILAIVDEVRDMYDLIWQENLNLRGSYRAVVLGCIAEHYPALILLYCEIYRKNNCSYWERPTGKFSDRLIGAVFPTCGMTILCNVHSASGRHDKLLLPRADQTFRGGKIRESAMRRVGMKKAAPGEAAFRDDPRRFYSPAGASSADGTSASSSSFSSVSDSSSSSGMTIEMS